MNLSGAFSYKIMEQMARYMATFNTESQVLAVDSNANDIQTTGTKLAYFDGAPIKLAVDAAMDVSGDTNESVTAWANATSYSVGDIRKNSDAEGSDVRLRCILAHTSNAVQNEPLVGDEWESYWVREPHGVATAAGATVGAGNTREFMVFAKRDGTLVTGLCGDDANSTTGFTLKVPQYDPYTYVPIGFVHVINADPSNTFTFGNTADTTNMTITYHNLTTPVFPHLDNINKK